MANIKSTWAKTHYDIVGEGICKFVHNGTTITPRDALYIPHIGRNFVSVSVVDERRYEVG